jgi:hypothetical protein
MKGEVNMKEKMELVIDFIKIVRKYYRTSDVDYLPKKHLIKDQLKTHMHWRKINLLEDLAKNSQRLNKTRQDIYKAYNTFLGSEELKEVK